MINNTDWIKTTILILLYVSIQACTVSYISVRQSSGIDIGHKDGKKTTPALGIDAVKNGVDKEAGIFNNAIDETGDALDSLQDNIEDRRNERKRRN